jgi:UvrD-like helicase C-terminal domain/UvrD/REP helicase N-terminal domain
MLFRTADTFFKALGKLTAQEQSQVKITVFDLQRDQGGSGLQMHRIDNSKDPNFWSVRVSRDIRIIVHKTASSFLVCFVAHHDDAYAWAERRRIDRHPTTGAAQIVEIRERVIEIKMPAVVPAVADFTEPEVDEPEPAIFAGLDHQDVLSVGVPEDWIDDVLAATEARFLDIADHLPGEAAEALLEYATVGILPRHDIGASQTEPFEHPDAQRRFRVMEDREELARALDYPWDQWTVFLHPSQRSVVEREFTGPARVAGSAGTGKTVVALHRAARLLRSDPDARVLLTTFSSPLANRLRAKLPMLTADDGRLLPSVTVRSWEGIARELFTLINGHEPRVARPGQVATAMRAAMAATGLQGHSERFLLSEWTNAIDAWQIRTLDDYQAVRRIGRRSRLGARQREQLWPVFDAVRQTLQKQNVLTWSMVFEQVADHYRDKPAKPFTHVIVDEAQDLGVPQLRMLSAIMEDRPNALFLAGDLGQRIFREPFSWRELGVDVRGRSTTLKVNYRTSHQIRQAADRLLPPAIRDADGIEEERSGTVSIFNGPEPVLCQCESEATEAQTVGTWLADALANGIEPDEIGVFVRHEALLPRARTAVRNAGVTVMEISDRPEEADGRVSVGTMHMAKGLEFKAVVVMACDDEELPLQSRMETAADSGEIEEIFDTERRLFYVACTRARDRLMVSGVEPVSDFFADFGETD